MRLSARKLEYIGYLLGLGLIAVATLIFLLGRRLFDTGEWALLYLLIIVAVASLSGIRPAIVASVAGFLAWNFFFIPPYYTLVVADPKDWLSLFVFLFVGITMGLQTGRLREREAQARAREQETALLNKFSAHLISELTVEEMADILATEVASSANVSCVTLFTADESGKLIEVPPPVALSCAPGPEVVEIVDWAFSRSKAVGLPETSRQAARPEGWPISVRHREAGFDDSRQDSALPLQTAMKQVGVLYIGERIDGKPYSVSEARMLVGLANQAAAFLERKRLQSLAVQADALREADRLKSTFVSSVSHELKTPLASITATVTNILGGDVAWDEARVRGELEAVREDLDRLNNSIGSLVDLSRLESAAWEPKRDWYEVGEILAATLTKLPEGQRSRVSFSVPEDLPSVCVDFTQMSRVFQNLLENALIYSGDDSPVRIGALCEADRLKVWVEDQGPGIPPDERTKIFDKFYRGEVSGKSPSGTGLGLAIVLEIIRSHGGRIWIEDVVPRGTRVVISLPRGPEDTDGCS